MHQKKILVVCTTDSMIYNFLVPHIRHLQDMGNMVLCACSRTGFFFDYLQQEEHLELVEVPFHRTPYHMENYTALRQLQRLIRDKGVDCVFCHEPVGGVIGRLAARTMKIPSIYCAHGFHFYKGAPKTNWLIYYTVEKLLSHCTHSLLTINQEDYQIAKQKMWAKNTYLINGIGVDMNKFSSGNADEQTLEKLRQDLGISKDTKVLLSVGELSPRKNYQELVTALTKVEYKNYVCLIVGEGDENEILQRQIEENGLHKKVRLLGYRRDIANLNTLCDLFVFVTKQEGLPMAIMEAMAAGNCVLASDVRGNVDLIQDGQGGVIYHLGNTDELAKSIDRILNDDEFARTCGEFNQKFVKNFAIDKVCEQMNEIYDRIV